MERSDGFTHRSGLNRRSFFWLIVALGVCTALQAAVIVLGDSRFSSGSDAGGRSGAIAAAAQSGGCDHDLGYWAAEADPGGRFHPHVNTVATADEYRQPASTMFVCASSALAQVFGPPAALAVPVAGVVLAALGAWILGRTTGGGGWLALVLVGAVGPVAFYGADTWEHAPSVGAAVLGTALLVRGTGGAGSGFIAGVLWGIAMALRLETGIVAVALGAAVLLVPRVRRTVLASRRFVAAFIGAGVIALATDRIVEQTVQGTDLRASQAVGSPGQVGQAGSDLAQRGVDVLVTTFGVFASEDATALVLGMGFVLALVAVALAVLGAVRTSPLLIVAGAVVISGAVLRAESLGFVPGTMAAAPVAVLGAVIAFRSDAPTVARTVAGASLAAMPFVWATQWTGSLVAQWGGRYQLLSGTLLTIAGASVIERRWASPAAKLLTALSVVIGLLGMAWHVERTNAFGDAWDELTAADCDGVLISTSEFFLREAGATRELVEQRIGDCRLLTAAPAELEDALDVAAELGIERAVVLDRVGTDSTADEVSGWVVSSVETHDLRHLVVTTTRLEERP